jgi:hypothetical protein
MDPTRTDDQLVEIPGLTLSITTMGLPVLIAVMLNVKGRGDLVQWSLIIDGQPRNQDQMSEKLSDVSDTVIGDALSYQRVVSLASGAHTIGVGMSCGGPNVLVYRSWLTAYELPAVKK